MNCTRNRKWKRSFGFSLLELLIIIVLIGILAGLAIPVLQRARMAANEADAIAFMRQLVSAQQLYLLKNGRYANTMLELLDSGVVGVGGATQIENRWVELPFGYKFRFEHLWNSVTTWRAVGHPLVSGETGERYFYVDNSGVIRYAKGRPAGDNSRPL